MYFRTVNDSMPLNHKTQKHMQTCFINTKRVSICFFCFLNRFYLGCRTLRCIYGDIKVITYMFSTDIKAIYVS